VLGRRAARALRQTACASRCRLVALMACALVAIGACASAQSAFAGHVAAGTQASSAARRSTARGLRRCKAFTIKRVRHGRVVRRHGRVVHTRRVRCVRVPAKACHVRWVARRKRRHHHWRLVIRHHNRVYVAKVHCPRTSAAPPAATPGPAPAAPAAGPGNAAVAVYAVTVQGETFQDEDFGGGIPAQSVAPIENVQQHGFLVRLITPFPGLNGPAQDEIGLFLGSLVELGPRAGTAQFATNTLMFTAADPGDPSLFDQLPFPYDIGQVAVDGEQLVALADLQSIEAAFPPGGKSADYFVDRSGLIAGTIKSINAAEVSLQFAGGEASVSGSFELQGGLSLTTPGLIPPSEYGLFGLRGTISGTRISPPGGSPIYLPLPLPSTPRPPGCRTELHLVPGLGDGSLSEQLVSVCA
jgi:hypothetical protein